MKHLFSSDFFEGRDMDVFIGKVLRYGVILSCLVTLFGGLIYILQQGGNIPDYSPIPDGEVFPGVDYYLRSLITIVPRVLDFDGAAIIQFGVCILIATPILRVVFAIVGFLVEKDFMYVGITIIVLVIIIANMILGLQ